MRNHPYNQKQKVFIRNITIAIFSSLFTYISITRGQQYELTSPNRWLKITMQTGKYLNWVIKHERTTVLSPSAIALQWQDEKSAEQTVIFSKIVKVTHADRKSIDIFFYFDNQAICRCVDILQESRHIWLLNEQIVLSPEWLIQLIHSGAGILNYMFIRDMTKDTFDYAWTT